MKIHNRPAFLAGLALVAGTGWGCGRIGYDDMGGGDATDATEPTRKLDADRGGRRDVGAHMGASREGGTKRDAGSVHPVDAHSIDAKDSAASTVDAPADTGGHPEAAIDTGTPDAGADTGARDAALEGGHDSGLAKDSGGSKDAAADVNLGCKSSADCRPEEACDIATHACTTSCSSTQLCNSCCSTSGTCITGPTATLQCVTLQPGTPTIQCEAAGVACLQCGGGLAAGNVAFVCGDGKSYGTVVNTSYSCSAAGSLGAGTACAFGCDTTSGKCKDLVPANQAGSHLASGDSFTCLPTGGVGVTPPPPDVITTQSGDTITINTSTPSISVGGQAITAPWGKPYMPTGGTNNVIVAHLKSLALAAGTTVSVTGGAGLVLLVDTDVSILGAQTSPSLVDVSAHFAATSGPGSTSAEPGAGTVGTSSQGGGGGGHGVAGGAGADGDLSTATGFGLGGPAYGHPFVLVAGSAGGGVAYDGVGKGGGALQISTCGSLTIGTDVVVNASGGGGNAGLSSGGASSAVGGYGGGSGGTIILEGQSATLDGILVANGGGGGQGSLSNGTAVAGSEWTTSLVTVTTPAPGGTSAGGTGAAGAGGAGTTPPGGGTLSTTGGGGAGGGAYGAISIGVSPLTATPNAGTVSPTPFYSITCTTSNGVAPTTCAYP